MLTLYISRTTYIHTHMYRVQLRKNINPKNGNVVTGIFEFIGTAKVPTSEVRTVYICNFMVNFVCDH
jgi:hypothetical protein